MSIEPYTGYVRALVGGYDFVEGGFNHATDAKRQPGSSFKPFIYGAALENGFTPASILMDLPVIHEKSEFEKKGWKPTNYDEPFPRSHAFAHGAGALAQCRHGRLCSRRSV